MALSPIRNIGAVSVPNQRRIPRRPQHRFYLETRPYHIQPFMIAPVIPGETMRNLLMQARIVTDPIDNPLIGWWAEMYFFYVKLNDLAGRADFTEMFIDFDKDLSAYYAAQSDKYYHESHLVPDMIPWTELCTDRIVEEYFRDESDGTVKVDGMHIAGVHTQSWMDSVQPAADYEAEDVNVDLDADTNIMASEVERAMDIWQLMSQHQLTDASYEDFLASYGIKVPPSEHHVPELIRYVREWSYPSNTINPSDGAPSSAVSWTLAERADKNRFIKEPGFIIGLQVIRPKVYFKAQAGAASALLSDALSWLPAIMRDDKRASLRSIANGTGPLSGLTADYIVDLRDLYLYGDQFTNVDLATASGFNEVTLPNVAGDRKYPDTTDMDSFFTGVSKLIKTDGVVNLDILGTTVDMTPGPQIT